VNNEWWPSSSTGVNDYSATIHCSQDGGNARWFTILIDVTAVVGTDMNSPSILIKLDRLMKGRRQCSNYLQSLTAVGKSTAPGRRQKIIPGCSAILFWPSKEPVQKKRDMHSNSKR
jgi:hypothetical protein